MPPTYIVVHHDLRIPSPRILKKCWVFKGLRANFHSQSEQILWNSRAGSDGSRTHSRSIPRQGMFEPRGKERMFGSQKSAGFVNLEENTAKH